MFPGSPFGGAAVEGPTKVKKVDDGRLGGPALAIVKWNNKPMEKPGRSYF
jgi:hypothetical protein